MTLQIEQNKTQDDLGLDNCFDYSILNYIAVSEPYFALKNIRNNNECTYAEFTSELKNILEHGTISTPEVGRHMAILGSLVLARENPKKEKHYYLANHAIIEHFSDIETDQLTYTGCAKIESFSGKKGSVSGTVFDNKGTVLYKIKVSYLILASTIFERIFETHKVVTPKTFLINPYTFDIKFDNIKLDIEKCTANGGVVKINDCIGHFNEFPACPIARIGTAMGNLGAMHFMHLNPGIKKKFKTCNTEIKANRLVFAGEVIKYRTEIVDPNPERGMIIRTIAYTDKCDFVSEAITNYHY